MPGAFAGAALRPVAAACLSLGTTVRTQPFIFFFYGRGGTNTHRAFPLLCGADAHGRDAQG